MMSDLAAFGWDEGFVGLFAAAVGPLGAAGSREPARVVIEERGQYLVRTAAGEIQATVSGRFRYNVDDAEAYPAVGDWVVLEPGTGSAVIHGVLPRRTSLVRRAPADHGSPTQVVAANVDLVFVMTSLDHDLNLRRLERYLAVVWESGARPIVVLSKADVAADVEGPRVAVEAITPGVPVLVVSALDGTGMDALSAHLEIGRTVAVVGSSGVGKSTLINALLGEALLDTGGIRADDSRGRHTTTRRQLVRLTNGLIVDTPGMREMGLADDSGLDRAFDDIVELAAACRFTDCRHDREPGCAVLSAIADGSLPRARLDAQQALEQDVARTTHQRDALARIEQRRRSRAIHKSVTQHMKAKYGDDR